MLRCTGMAPPVARLAAFETGFESVLGELQAHRRSSGGHGRIFTAGLYENARFFMPT
jgi:hypothetical protein